MTMSLSVMPYTSAVFTPSSDMSRSAAWGGHRGSSHTHIREEVPALDLPVLDRVSDNVQCFLRHGRRHNLVEQVGIGQRQEETSIVEILRRNIPLEFFVSVRIP